MAFQAFDDLLNQLRVQHNQELDELRLQLESRDDEITQYKLKVKQLEFSLKVENNEEFLIKLRSISTQTDPNNDRTPNDSQDNGKHFLEPKIFINYCDPESRGSHPRRPGRPPARKATRKIVVSQRRRHSSSPTPSSSTTTSKKIVLSEAELRNHILKNMKRVCQSSDDSNSDDEDITSANKNISKKRINRSNIRYSLGKSLGGRKRDKVWEHFEDLGQSINGRFRRAKCFYCGQEFHTSKANLMVRHLANKCNLCPKVIIDEYMAKLENEIEGNSGSKSSKAFLSESGVRLGGRPRGKAWEHFEDLGRSEHGTFRVAKCHYCDTVYPISKLKLLNRHLAKECVLCPKEVTNQFSDQNNNSITDSFDNEDNNCGPEEEVEEEEEEEQSSETELKLCGRRRAKVWEHYKDMGRGKHGSFRKAKCLYCNALFPLSRLTSMTRHLAKCCVLCPKEVVNEYLYEYNKYCQKRSADNEFIDCNNDNDFEGDKDSLFYEEDLNP